MRAASRSRKPKKLVRPPLARAAISCCSAGRGGGRSPKRSRPFGPQRAGEQSRRPRRAASACPRAAADRVDDRHGASRAARPVSQHRRGERAFGDGCACADQRLGRARPPSPSALPSEKVAAGGRRAGQHQIAEARQARQRFRLRAAGQAEAHHFGKAARDQRGAGILAQPQPLDHAAGDGEHVLDRAADFRAGDIVGVIGSEGGPGDER